jgi:hypothetical protein
MAKPEGSIESVITKVAEGETTSLDSLAEHSPLIEDPAAALAVTDEVFSSTNISEAKRASGKEEEEFPFDEFFFRSNLVHFVHPALRR